MYKVGSGVADSAELKQVIKLQAGTRQVGICSTHSPHPSPCQRLHHGNPDPDQSGVLCLGTPKPTEKPLTSWVCQACGDQKLGDEPEGANRSGGRTEIRGMVKRAGPPQCSGSWIQPALVPGYWR